ncbi:MAG: dUTP diphosphatase [Bacillota bacterium]
MDRIGYNEPDRFEKTILALLVEVGECANEWRGFKYWSKDQEPRIVETQFCVKCDGCGTYLYWNYEPGVNKMVKCEECDGDGEIKSEPLLEEYVDGLHFVLQLGIEVGVTITEIVCFDKKNFRYETVTEQFLDIKYRILEIWDSGSKESMQFYWERLFIVYAELGEMLGFTWEQIEQAYMDKNKINHERQENGY